MRSKHQPVTLLLIEDDDVDVMTIEREFAKKSIGNQIIRACDGQEALELLQNNMVPSPYVILLDLNMPRMNGLEFLENIKAAGISDLNIAMYSSSSRPEEQKQVMQYKSVIGYVDKPINQASLATLLNELNQLF